MSPQASSWVSFIAVESLWSDIVYVLWGREGTMVILLTPSWKLSSYFWEVIPPDHFVHFTGLEKPACTQCEDLGETFTNPATKIPLKVTSNWCSIWLKLQKGSWQTVNSTPQTLTTYINSACSAEEINLGARLWNDLLWEAVEAQDCLTEQHTKNAEISKGKRVIKWSFMLLWRQICFRPLKQITGILLFYSHLRVVWSLWLSTLWD